MKNDPTDVAENCSATAAGIHQLVDRLRQQVREDARQLEREFLEGRNRVARSLGAGRGFCPVALTVRMNQVKPTIVWRHLIKRDPKGNWYSRQIRRDPGGCARERLTKLLTQVAPEYLDFILDIEDQLQRWMPAAQDALELTRWQAKRRKSQSRRTAKAEDHDEPEWRLPEELTHGGEHD